MAATQALQAAHLAKHRPRCRSTRLQWRGCSRCTPAQHTGSTSTSGSLLDDKRASQSLRELELEAGLVRIVHMTAEDVHAASLMMGRSFCDVGALSIQEIREFLEMTLTEWPDAAAYVARLYPRDGSKIFVPEGKDHRVAGIVLLSFTDATRDSFLAMNELPVPDHSVYLANMAVDKAFRRMGIAQHLIDVCVEQSRGAHVRRNYICLHVHEDNAGATALYERAGFRIHNRPPPPKVFKNVFRDPPQRNNVMLYQL